jgi:hypothetical protein
MHLTTETSGWILTDRGVWWTNDFAGHWTNKALPPQVQPQDIGDSFFLDE